MKNTIFKDFDTIIAKKKTIVSSNTNLEPGIGLKFTIYDGSNFIEYTVGLVKIVRSLRRLDEERNYKLVHFKNGTDEYITGPVYSGGLTGFGIQPPYLTTKKAFKTVEDLKKSVSNPDEYFDGSAIIIYNNSDNPLEAVKQYNEIKNKIDALDREQEDKYRKIMQRRKDLLNNFKETITLSDGSKYDLTYKQVKSYSLKNQIIVSFNNKFYAIDNYMTPTGKIAKKALIDINSDPDLLKELFKKVFEIQAKWDAELSKV